MSNDPRIGLIAEGPTDFIIIRAVLDRVFGDRTYVSVEIQPELSEIGSQGPLGGGWKGVLNWCRNNTLGLADITLSLPYKNFDLLIVQVDSDIAFEGELTPHNLARDCPPASVTCEEIRKYLAGLMGCEVQPEKVIFCVPAQSTELWVFTALFPTESIAIENIECYSSPKRLLYQKRGLVKIKEGEYKNQKGAFAEAKNDISSGWPNSVAQCPQANHFNSDLLAFAL